MEFVQVTEDDKRASYASSSKYRDLEREVEPELEIELRS